MTLGVNGRFYSRPVWGVQRFAREVCRRLRARAPAMLFLPADGEGASWRTDPSGALRGGVHRGHLRGHVWEQLELPYRARRAGCDVLLHLGGTAPLYGGPHVVALHDVFPLTHPEWFSRPFVLWFRSVVAPAAARAAALVVPSDWAAGEVSRVLGVPGSRLHVARQGTAPFTAPAPEGEVRRVRERYALPERYLLTLAGDDPRKNPAFLQRVLSRWAARGGDPPVLAVVGAHRARVHGRAGRPAPAASGTPGAPLRVCILGYVDDRDLRALYTGARAFCFPSSGEGFGRPPLEAMACGTPVVVAPYGCAHEILGDAARIVPLDDDAWIGALEASMAEGEEREKYVRAGVDRARAFRWDDAAEAVLEACRSVAASRSARPARGAAPTERRHAADRRRP